MSEWYFLQDLKARQMKNKLEKSLTHKEVQEVYKYFKDQGVPVSIILRKKDGVVVLNNNECKLKRG